MPTIKFLGAAQTVTGSCHLLCFGRDRFLLDCGQFQGPWHIEKRNYEPIGVYPATLSGVILSHGHLDHCGRIPLLARLGFDGPVYCTPPTKDISMLILMDSAHLLKEEFLWKKRRLERVGIEAKEPLYSAEDVWYCHDNFSRPVDYGERVRISERLDLTFHPTDAGHVLGSSQVYLEYRPKRGRPLKILFSGDLGDGGRPVVNDPTPPEKGVDVLIMESTYGDRMHRSYEDSVAEFREEVMRTIKKKGTVLIPTFALERAQEILYHLGQMKREGLLSRHVPVFLNSPLAINITRVFQKHCNYCDKEVIDEIRRKRSPFIFPGLQLTETAEESKMIHSVPSPKIVLAGSGMITGGRIKHHLKHNLWKDNTTVIIVGYQASNTLGRQLVNGAKTVKIFGEEIKVRARIVTINGFSAHADKGHLLRYAKAVSPKKIFLVHGEPETQRHLKRSLNGVLPRTEVVIPEFKSEHPLAP